jgi:hypothetical protein
VSKIACDRWWEPESQWHRDWKDRFPIEWQEQRRIAANGEVHIADVLTEAKVVLEFQRSHISDQERFSRERFHRRMVWVVDGTRLKGDGIGFARLLSGARVVLAKHLAFILPIDGSAIVRRWKSERPVYLDFDGDAFGIPGLPENLVLWRLRFGKSGVLLMPVSYDSFVAYHRGNLSLIGFPVRYGREVTLTEFQRHLISKDRRRPRS